MAMGRGADEIERGCRTVELEISKLMAEDAPKAERRMASVLGTLLGLVRIFLDILASLADMYI